MDYVLDFLKDIIKKYGFTYLAKNPYEIYMQLINNKTPKNTLDPAKARAILSTLLAKIPNCIHAGERDIDTVTSKIQETCLLEKSAAQEIAEMYISLLSEKNLQDWQDESQKNIDRIINEGWKFEWYGENHWTSKFHTRIDYTVEISFFLKVIDKEKVRKEIKRFSSEDEFISYEFIIKHYDFILSNFLNDELDGYTDDRFEDYYEPYMEDFPGNFSDALQELCEKYGLTYEDLEYSYEDNKEY